MPIARLYVLFEEDGVGGVICDAEMTNRAEFIDKMKTLPEEVAKHCQLARASLERVYTVPSIKGYGISYEVQLGSRHYYVHLTTERE